MYPYYPRVTWEPRVMESPHKNTSIADEKLGCAATKKVACYLLTPASACFPHTKRSSRVDIRVLAA